jgi:hypothetical protein
MFAAPTGTALPTDANTALIAAYKDVGLVSVEGPTFSHNLTTVNVNAYGTLQATRVIDGQRTDTVQVTLQEALNPTAVAIYNKMPLTGTGSITVTADATAGKFVVPSGQVSTLQYTMVWHFVDGGNLVRRWAPFCEVTVPGDETFNVSDVTKLPLTITMYPDSSGNAYYTAYYVLALHS